MITKPMKENAHKVAYLVQQYPEHTIKKIIDLLAMPAIDINTAIWAAVELGYISDPNPKDNTVQFLTAPKKWQFGTTVTDLQAAIHYAFIQTAKKEIDFEENYLSQWTQGYAAHDVLIVMKRLINDKVLAEYQLEDGSEDDEGGISIYTFFTLYENSEQLWGRKQFKQAPEATPDNSKEEV